MDSSKTTSTTSTHFVKITTTVLRKTAFN